MADLASFQAQANSIYDPQAAAEKATLTTNYNSGKAASELSKTDANTNYDRALRGVDQNEKTSVDNLNNLYSQRLGGQFSGLQGNALQGLYGKDNQARADLSQNRISMLAKITGQETAATNRYNTDNSNVDSKFSSEKNRYATEGYNSALKQEETERKDAERQANSDRQFALSEERFSASEARANSKADKAPSEREVTSALQEKLDKVIGGDGKVSPQDFASAHHQWVQAGLDASKFEGYFGKYKGSQKINGNNFYDYQLGLTG